MRLVCPKCGAQYEVEASAIPPEGREVQCGSCGHSWLQFPDHAEEATGATAAEGAPAAETDPSVRADDAKETAFERRQRRRRERAAAQDGQDDAPSPLSADAAADGQGGGADDDTARAPSAAPTFAARSSDDLRAGRPPVSAEALEILRSEAAHEANARRNGTPAQRKTAGDEAVRSEPDASFVSSQARRPRAGQIPGQIPGAGPHSRPVGARLRNHELRERERRLHILADDADQGDDGPDETDTAAARAPRRPAHRKGVQAQPHGTGPADPRGAPWEGTGQDADGDRAEMLPDPSSIEHSLQPDRRARAGRDRRPRSVIRRRRGHGFRNGFLLAVLLALLMTAAYILAPQIKTALPGSADILDGFVNAIDAARRTLDDGMRALFDRILGA